VRRSWKRASPTYGSYATTGRAERVRPVRHLAADPPEPDDA
jgi:hypothetical protein